MQGNSEFSAKKPGGDPSYTPTAMRNSLGAKSISKYEVGEYQDRNNSMDRQVEMNYEMNREMRNLNMHPQATKIGNTSKSLMNVPCERNEHFPSKVTVVKERSNKPQAK